MSTNTTEQSVLCRHCAAHVVRVKGLCSACYEYQRWSGVPRPRALIEKAARKLHPLSGEASDPKALTSREREVLHLLGEGLTSAAVAAHLFISVRTVHFHCRNAYCKLGAHTLVQALNAVREQECKEQGKRR